jgi:autotransporter translocation and assembly factor TamB
MHRNALFQIAVLVPIVISGCSKGRPMGDVQGRVTLNGQRLSEGAVRFIPLNGDTQATGGSIRDGKFRVQVPVSKQRVEFSANVVDREKTPPNATGDQIVMKILVPARYNTHSELTLDVLPGLNEPEFKLTNP